MITTDSYNTSLKQIPSLAKISTMPSTSLDTIQKKKNSILTIVDYREREQQLSKLREQMAEIVKEQRATNYARVGRWIENNLSRIVKRESDTFAKKMVANKLK